MPKMVWQPQLDEYVELDTTKAQRIAELTGDPVELVEELYSLLRSEADSYNEAERRNRFGERKYFSLTWENLEELMAIANEHGVMVEMLISAVGEYGNRGFHSRRAFLNMISEIKEGL